MKIVHVYSQNLKLFEEAIEGTGCHINGSTSLEYMRKSLSNFNARDVMGLIVFKNPMTKRTLKLMREFDELHIFHPLPIVLISDMAHELYQARKIKIKHSPLFLVDSFENTVSDIDIHRVFATLSCHSDEMYDLSQIEAHGGNVSITGDVSHGSVIGVGGNVSLADSVVAAYSELSKRE